MKKSSFEIIERAIKKIHKESISFELLPSYDQVKVLKNISKLKLDIKVLGQKWFDILSNKFYSFEYELDDNTISGIHKELREFDNVESFCEYVTDQIYISSCYFGFVFPPEIISKYNIELSKLNFNSFITETIDDNTFDSISSSELSRTELAENDVLEIKEWVDKMKLPTSLIKLNEAKTEFENKWDKWDNASWFFSFILNKFDKRILKLLIREFTEFGSRGINFEDFLFTYGDDVAKEIIAKYDSHLYSSSTIKKHLYAMNNILDKYEKGLFKEQVKGNYDIRTHLYKIVKIYSYSDYNPLIVTRWFLSFDQLKNYVNNNLENINLINAPISKDDLKDCKIHDTTILPAWNGYSSYKITKEYYKGNFYVSQEWLDNDGNVIKKISKEFKRVFDFIHYLNGDISQGDYIMCDQFENLSSVKGLNTTGILVRSNVAEKFGLGIKTYNLETKPSTFEVPNKFELETQEILLSQHTVDDDYSSRVSYVTDIHLSHRYIANHLKTLEDRMWLFRDITSNISNESKYVVLIGGDTSDNINDFETFCKYLKHVAPNKYFIFVLGNHELWFQNASLETVIKRYKEILTKYDMYLLQNNIFYLDNYDLKEINETELENATTEDLRKKMRAANLVVFGGIGFSGKNNYFNAERSAIYTNTVNREQEILESIKCSKLHDKVSNALPDKNVIILTHMPFVDWAEATDYTKGFVYVNGHNHRNYFYDDGIKRIYADNQIGYKQKYVHMKDIPVNTTFDWFADYADGIYEITREDYQMFYRGIIEKLSFNRDCETIYMLKKDNTYMFLIKTLKGKYNILNGGSVRNAGNHELDYFYNNLSVYAQSVKMFLGKYDAFQKNISKEIKRIGGDGRIHGSIVDIDFLNHLYLNPLDGSITPYYALSMVDKYVYPNLISLLNSKCPTLYENYLQLLETDNGEQLSIIKDFDNKISNKSISEYSTEMYKVSRVLKGLQFTTKYNVVRIWNDAFIGNPSEDNGRLIVQSIILPYLSLDKTK